ncbi:MAG: hypothetical protein RJA07_2670 [Bacteroidota bacterium]|jgi:hypothetical protein
MFIFTLSKSHFIQKIFSLLFLFSFFACQNKNKLSNNSTPKEQAITKSPSVFGKWVMCYSNFNGGGMSYNVCPIIKFNAFNGEYIYQAETFIYKADYALNKLQVTNKTKTSSIIDDGIYQMIFSKKEQN